MRARPSVARVARRVGRWPLVLILILILVASVRLATNGEASREAKTSAGVTKRARIAALRIRRATDDSGGKKRAASRT